MTDTDKALKIAAELEKSFRVWPIADEAAQALRDLAAENERLREAWQFSVGLADKLLNEKEQLPG